jgi:hypothetical protein
MMADTPAALQLRLLQTIVEVAAEKNSAVVLPFPVELLRFLDQAAAGTAERSSGSDLRDPKRAGESRPAVPAAAEAAITNGTQSPPPADAETLKAAPTAPA